MRKTKIDTTTIEYPDEIGFCFNPIVINVYGFTWSYIDVTITDKVTSVEKKEKRAMFGSSCFFDLSPYAQGFFDLLNFNKVDYSAEAQDSQVGRLFSVEVDLYISDGTLGNTFQFDTFIIWGAMKAGERYNGNRSLTWFKHFPFSVGIYSATNNSAVNITVDGVPKSTANLSGRSVWNLMLDGIEASKEVVFELPGSASVASVFDNTFDFTFFGLLNTATKVLCSVDDSNNGVYLRWIDRHGFYCYWLFKSGDENRQVANDGEFIRNNMADYNYVNGYHGGTGRKQKKTENNTLPVCAPLVDSDMYDFLFQLVTSPVVDMYAGTDDEGVCRWQAVNIAIATFVKTRKNLQDFVATIILPETRVQNL